MNITTNEMRQGKNRHYGIKTVFGDSTLILLGMSASGISVRMHRKGHVVFEKWTYSLEELRNTECVPYVNTMLEVNHKEERI
jgi:Zn-dependent membrane protease YugP